MLFDVETIRVEISNCMMGLTLDHVQDFRLPEHIFLPFTQILPQFCQKEPSYATFAQFWQNGFGKINTAKAHEWADRRDSLHRVLSL
jgi:hypothetical protein